MYIKPNLLVVRLSKGNSSFSTLPAALVNAARKSIADRVRVAYLNSTITISTGLVSASIV